MINKTKETVSKWIIGIAVSVALGLLSILVTVTVSMNNAMMSTNKTLIEFVRTNAKEHAAINETLKGVNDFTEYVYKYEIQPNTRFREESMERAMSKR